MNTIQYNTIQYNSVSQNGLILTTSPIILDVYLLLTAMTPTHVGVLDIIVYGRKNVRLGVNGNHGGRALIMAGNTKCIWENLERVVFIGV